MKRSSKAVGDTGITFDSASSWSDTQKEAVADGLVRLTKGEFLAAHERFEDLWREASLPARLAFHGLAQLAASFHQLALGRGRAAVRTWDKARDKLARAGLLSERYVQEMTALHARLGLTAEGPRFFDPAALGPPELLPRLVLPPADEVDERLRSG